MLWQELKRKGLVPTFNADTNEVPANHLPAKEINLVFDNCSGQNKNRMLFRFLFFLVKRRVAFIARAIFLVRGHTKNDCDRMFNLLKKDYRLVNVYTPEDLFKVLNQREDIDVVHPDGFYDWDSVEDRYLKVPEDVKPQHIFTVDANRDNTVSTLYLQLNIGEPETEQELLLPEYKFMGDWSAEQLAQPELIESPGIQDIKWRELFDKWGPLIPVAKRSEWKFTANDPGKKRREGVKDNTKKSKQIRLDRQRTHGTKKLPDASTRGFI